MDLAPISFGLALAVALAPTFAPSTHDDTAARAATPSLTLVGSLLEPDGTPFVGRASAVVTQSTVHDGGTTSGSSSTSVFLDVETDDTGAFSRPFTGSGTNPLLGFDVRVAPYRADGSEVLWAHAATSAYDARTVSTNVLATPTEEPGRLELQVGGLRFELAPAVAELTFTSSTSEHVDFALVTWSDVSGVDLTAHAPTGRPVTLYSCNPATEWTLVGRGTGREVVPVRRIARGAELAVPLVRVSDLTVDVDRASLPDVGWVAVFPAEDYAAFRPVGEGDQGGRALRRIHAARAAGITERLHRRTFEALADGRWVVEAWSDAGLAAGVADVAVEVDLPSAKALTLEKGERGSALRR
ncbi:MAG: hypothetical protein R3F34_13300 [Planctomycetota bacterium]